MNTDEATADGSAAEADDGTEAAEATEATEATEASDAPDAAAEPSWWHRDHPTFTSLVGFFTGLLVVIIVPGAFAAVLRATFDYDTAEELFPFVLVVLAVPLALIAVPRTRRFGRYMLLGMLTTAVVVVGVAALVVWILIRTDS